jgi:hypothetical protein
LGESRRRRGQRPERPGKPTGPIRTKVTGETTPPPRSWPTLDEVGDILRELEREGLVYQLPSGNWRATPVSMLAAGLKPAEDD